MILIVIACLEFRWQTITSVAHILKKSGYLPREQEFRNVEFHPTPLNICFFARHSKRFDASPRLRECHDDFSLRPRGWRLRASRWLSSAATWMMRAFDLLRRILKFIIHTFMWGDVSCATDTGLCIEIQSRESFMDRPRRANYNRGAEYIISVKQVSLLYRRNGYIRFLQS